MKPILANKTILFTSRFYVSIEEYSKFLLVIRPLN